MERPKEKNFGFKLSIGALLVILALAGLYSLSILDNLPFLKIKQLKLIANNPHLAALARRVIEKEAENNILFLKLKKDLIADILRKKSHFQIENFRILETDLLSRSVVLKLIENKPLAKFNKKYCLSQSGRVYIADNCKGFRLYDKTSLWREGNFYNLTPKVKYLAEKFTPKKVIVDKFFIKLYTDNLIVYGYKDGNDFNRVLTYKERIERTLNEGKYLSVFNLSAEKAYYVKIIRERRNE